MNSYEKYFLIDHNFKLITSINQFKYHNKPVNSHTQVRIKLLYIFFYGKAVKMARETRHITSVQDK